MTRHESDAAKPTHDTDTARDRSLSLNKETIKDLDATGSDADEVKGGGSSGHCTILIENPIKPLA